MAVLWHQVIGGRDYQVRKAGNSLRLYTEGVFHTQYNPQQMLSGGVWDLLSLPALLHPEGSIRRVLVLGVGGGAVIHLLRALVQPEQVVGVEIDPVHVRLMKKFFGLRGADIELRVADGVEFVRHYRGPKFDLIVDDLFYEQDGEPQRVIDMDYRWMKALGNCLKRKGMLVSNFVDRPQFRRALRSAEEKQIHWNHVLTMTLPTYENCVGIFSRQDHLMTDIHASLRKLAAINKNISLRRVRFNLKQIR
jgi:spermidine synthase